MAEDLGESGKRTLYLDERGAPAIRELLFEHVYSLNSDITREQLYDFTPFQLFERMAKASKFPLPATTGKGTAKKYQLPDRLPRDMERSEGYKSDATHYYRVLELLLECENRDATRSYLGRSPGREGTRGFTPPNTINEEPFLDILRWMHDRLVKNGVVPTLPKLPKDAPRQTWSLPESLYSGERGERLKAAFCRGLGRDPAQDNRDFITLFRDEVQERPYWYHAEHRFYVRLINLQRKQPAETLLSRAEDTGEVTKLSYQVNNLLQRRLLVLGTNLMDEELAEQCGQVVAMQHGWKPDPYANVQPDPRVTVKPPEQSPEEDVPGRGRII